MINLQRILINLHLYSLPDNKLLQCDKVKIWSIAFGIPLPLAGFTMESSSALTLSLPKAPGRSVLTLGDGSTFLTKEIPTTKLVPDETVYIFACRAHFCGWS